MSLHRSASLPIAVCLFLLPSAGRAGITYDFVDHPSLQNSLGPQYDITGSITVDPSALATGHLTRSEILSFSLSVVSGPSTIFTVDNLATTNLNLVNVSISSAQIFLIPPPVGFGESDFLLRGEFPVNSSIVAAFNVRAGPSGPSSNELSYGAEYDSSGYFPLWGDDLTQTPITNFLIADRASSPTPAPSSLVMAMTLAVCIGVAGIPRLMTCRQRITDVAQAAGHPT